MKYCLEYLYLAHYLLKFAPMGYIPCYTRIDLTDALHENFGFRTDYEITTDVNMKKIIRQTKKKK